MTLRDAFQAVYERHGELTPRLVVEEARNGTDAAALRLREMLPWDADEALYNYQLVIAAKEIRRLKMVYKPTPRSGLREVRSFVSVPAPSGRAYHPTDKVAADPLLSRLLLQEAERAWRDLKVRYGQLSGFVEMVRRDLDGLGREAA